MDMQDEVARVFSLVGKVVALTGAGSGRFYAGKEPFEH